MILSLKNENNIYMNRSIDEQPENTTVSTIIRQLMKEAHVNEAELARQLDMPQSTINRLLLGHSADPRANTLKPIAEYFCVTIGQLLGIEPLLEKRITGTTRSVNRTAWTSLPIIEWEDVLPFKFNKNKYTPSNYAKWLISERDLSSESFALKALSFMEPRFKRNSIIIVDPKSVINDGNFVVVSENNRIPTVKRYVRESDYVLLLPLKVEYGEAPSKLDNKLISFIAPIIETRTNELHA